MNFFDGCLRVDITVLVDFWRTKLENWKEKGGHYFNWKTLSIPYFQLNNVSFSPYFFSIHKLSETFEVKQWLVCQGWYSIFLFILFIFSTRKVLLLEVLDDVFSVDFYIFYCFMSCFIGLYACSLLTMLFVGSWVDKGYFAGDLYYFHPIISYISLSNFHVAWNSFGLVGKWKDTLLFCYL